MKSVKRLTRRDFLRKSAAATLGAAAFPYIIPCLAFGANDRVNIGCIGNGPQGTGLMRGVLGHAQARVVAVCDVNRLRRDEAKRAVDQQYGNTDCVAYNDFRELLARGDIDGVVIATPDHWHVPIGVYAAKAGKDMYIEKPLMLSLSQGQVLRETVQRYGRVYQYGTQQRSSWEFRFACELVRNQRIGELKRIKVGSPASIVSETIAPEPVPDWLDYDRWLGPAPWAPYSEKRIVNAYWWHKTDYALGFVAGWGIHHVDIAQWGAGADEGCEGGKGAKGVVEVEGTGVFPADGFCDCATKWNVIMRYADGVILDYTDEGQNRHGITFEGTEGWVYVARGVIDAQPKRLLMTAFGPGDVRLYESKNHIGNYLDCIRSRVRTICPIEVAIRSDMICHLSDIAMRLGRKLRWDPAQERFLEDDGANRMLTRAMRAPWQV